MTVKSLTIQSPMAINLQGIGEIIREVHEGVNDVYRNPLERRRREQQLEHNAQMNKMEVAETKLKLIRDVNQAMLEIGMPDEDRQATLKALLDPAKDTADMVTQKNLEIEQADQRQGVASIQRNICAFSCLMTE